MKLLRVVILGPLLIGCSEAAAPDLPRNAIVVDHTLLDEVHTSAISGFADWDRRVIRSKGEFREFWTEFHAYVQPQPPLPDVDFSMSVVIAAMMGQKSTGGYRIEIEGVWLDGSRTLVAVKETSPSGECLVTQGVTSPVTAVIVPDVAESVEFVESDATASCG